MSEPLVSNSWGRDQPKEELIKKIQGQLYLKISILSRYAKEIMKLLLSRDLSQSPSKRLCSEDSHRPPANSLHHFSKNKAWWPRARSAADYSGTSLHQPQQQSGVRNGLSWRTREYEICLQRSTGLEGNLTGAAWKTVWWANTSHQSESRNERDYRQAQRQRTKELFPGDLREKSSSRHFWKCARYRLWGYHRAWASISTEKACGNSLLTVLHKHPCELNHMASP